MSCRAVEENKTRRENTLSSITVQSLSSESTSHSLLKTRDEGQCLHEHSFENLYEYKVIDTIINPSFQMSSKATVLHYIRLPFPEDEAMELSSSN